MPQIKFTAASLEKGIVIPGENILLPYSQTENKIVTLTENEYNSLFPGILFWMISTHKKYLGRKKPQNSLNYLELLSPRSFPCVNTFLL